MDIKNLSKVTDSHRNGRVRTSQAPVRRVGDHKAPKNPFHSRGISNLRSRLMDTKSTEEAKQVALDALQEAPAAEVLSTVIDLLAGVIDRLSVEDPE